MSNVTPTPSHQNQPNSDPRYTWVLMGVFCLLATIALVGVIVLIARGTLTSAEAARHVITVVFTIGTLAIAIVLVLAVILMQDNNALARFQRGKDVLTILVGILGTIIGFYFGTQSAELSSGPTKTQETESSIDSPPETPPSETQSPSN